MGLPGAHSEVNSGKISGLRAEVPNGKQGGIFPDFTLNTLHISTTVEKVKERFKKLKCGDFSVIVRLYVAFVTTSVTSFLFDSARSTDWLMGAVYSCIFNGNRIPNISFHFLITHPSLSPQVQGSEGCGRGGG